MEAHNPDFAVDENQAKHALVSSWFLGPRAENLDILHTLFGQALERQRQAREDLANANEQHLFITDQMKTLEIYQESVRTLTENALQLSDKLAEQSVPFWSPRYNAHMNMDTTLASIIGYMTTMLYNPNNVAIEASPYTTEVERQVGQELSEMLGYNGQHQDPAPWGHITCDGSVANLEAIWATRNLKFYPLSLKLAIEQGPLKFLGDIKPPFMVETCNAGPKEFMDLTKEELLNLKPSTVLSIPTLLDQTHSIRPSFLQDALKPYLMQTMGNDEFKRIFDIKDPKYLICATKHYSWPKGGAISGIGSNNFVDIDVDNEARMNPSDLCRKLDQCIRDQTPILGVVAVMGSTEQGACDPLAEIIRIRDEYQQEKGVSFAVHCDAAWGGYFASLLWGPELRLPLPYVPAMPLHPYTKKQLRALQYADSITIDPHKSGYINYPAGGLCYRDGRMRFLLTWTSPIVFHDGDDQGSMGVYGVEGSKPGASVVATWLTHRSLALNQDGYGRLLGEAIFSCTKLYCHWATMTPRRKDESWNRVPADALIVAPLIRLPSEKNGGDVEAEKEYIREQILKRDNKTLFEDEEAWKMLGELGGDLMINAFATNFKVGDVVNEDVGEANYLNQWIFSKLSVSYQDDVIKERPLFLTSSVFGVEAYGKCLETFKRRMGLQTTTPEGEIVASRGDMRFLVNVTMSPWPTSPDFMSGMVEDFRRIAEQGVERCLLRNTLTPDFHGFVVLGGLDDDVVYFSHIAMFHMADHRRQLIFAAEFPEHMRERYREERRKHPGQFYTVANVHKTTLDDLLAGLLEPSICSKIEFRLDKGIPSGESPAPPVQEGFALGNVRVVVIESMAFAALDDQYPTKMAFYLFGSQNEVHVDHVLKKAPNAQISDDAVQTDLTAQLTDEQLGQGVFVVLDDVFEASMQPLPLLDKASDKKKQILNLDAPGLSLVKGVTHKASVYETWQEARTSEGKTLARGVITIGNTVYTDWHDINIDPASKLDQHRLY